MGQHLHLYASTAVNPGDVDHWHRKRADVGQWDEARVARVERIMKSLEGTDRHLEHWSAGAGVSVFGDLMDANPITHPLIEDTKRKAREFREWQIEHRPGSTEARHDWENDDAVKFLEAHLWHWVWGYNDGI